MKSDLETMTERYTKLAGDVEKESDSYGRTFKKLLDKPEDESKIKGFLKVQADVLGRYIGYFKDLANNVTGKMQQLEGKIYNAKLDIAVAEGVFPTELIKSTTLFMEGQLIFYNTIIQGSNEVVGKINSTIGEIQALVNADNFSETLKIISYMRQEANG